MSLNLGNEAIEAARKLALQGVDFLAIREALCEQARRAMNAALDNENPQMALAALGYARALRDVHLALEAAALGVNQRTVEKPGPVKGAK